MKYSVLYEKVIPVLMTDGTRASFGIHDTFLRAHEIRSIDCDSPLERYALLRLLVAFAMDMLHPVSWEDRQDLLSEGAFDPDILDEYIALCEEDGPRFDLFDPVHPFLQSAYDAKLDEKAVKSIANLSITVPSGNNHVFWDHRPEDEAAMAPDAAFRALLAMYVFCTAGAQGYPSGINNTPPVYSCLTGDSLFSTIILNMAARKECAPLEYGEEIVPWRQGKEVIPKEETVSVSMLEALTWQPRRITLLPEPDGKVRRIAFQQGRNFRGNDLWSDPHVSYRYNPKGGWFSVKPQPGRALWRDLGTLISDKSGLKNKPPLVIRQAPRVLDDEDGILWVHSVGLVTNNAAYVEWMEDELSVPAAFLTDDDLAILLRDDVERSETMEKGLNRAINTYFSSDKKHSDTLAEQARLYYLSLMHDVIFGRAIPDLLAMRGEVGRTSQQKHRGKVDEWVLQAIRETFRFVVESNGNRAEMLKAQVEAYQYTMNQYYKYLKEKEVSE